MPGSPNPQEVRPGVALPERAFTPSNVSLFLYNAAIWNAHRIHYDEPYTRDEEGHPGVVVDGPLQGDWLAQAAVEWMGEGGTLLELEYSNRRAAYVGEPLTVSGTVASVDAEASEVTLELFVKNENGEIITPGRAVVRLSQ